MKYLLDTHTFLWMFSAPENFSKNTLELLTNIENDLYISIISFWEISLKYSLGKLDLGKKIKPEDLLILAREESINLLHMSPENVLSFYRLPKFEHKDPFDRMLIWEAISNKMILISKDSNFDKYKELGLKAIW